jgi:outer membrane protein TolC
MKPRSRIRGQSVVPAGVVIALLGAGCTTPAPPAPPDTAAVAGPFRQSPASAADAPDAGTWVGFDDPVLDALIARARAANLDVRIAAQRVHPARAGGTAAASRLLLTGARPLDGPAAQR